MKKSGFVLVIAMMLMLAVQGIVSAQETPLDIPPFAFVQDEGTLLIAEPNSDPEEVHSATTIHYLDWNQKGTLLAFLQRNRLGVYDRESGAITLLETPTLEPAFNLSWMADGRILFATDSAETDRVDNMYKIDLLAIEPTKEAQPELLGTFDYRVGCGGGIGLPSEWIYAEETSGFRGNFHTLVETPYGILTTLSCSGSGIGLLDPATDELTVVDENLWRVVVSPDGTQIAGIVLDFLNPAASRLLVYNLETLEWSEIETTGPVDQLTWNPASTELYYTTRIVADNAVKVLNIEQQREIEKFTGYPINPQPLYRSEIYRVILSEKTTTPIMGVDAYAIARMTLTPSGLYFTTIPNLTAWLEAAGSGQVTPLDYDEDERALVMPEVYHLSFEGEMTNLGQFSQFTPFISP